MTEIKIKTPAKINLTLEILEKRKDGYHNIQSIMQAVSLYDTLTITVEEIPDCENIIETSGNNPIIPYNKTNLAYISAEKFLEKARISHKRINIYIDKHIPVAAGLAGGSSNAAGVLYGLNKILDKPLAKPALSDLASLIGSDVNFCLYGGTQIATSRGEQLEKITTPDLNIVIIKPENLFISAKEAYEKYSKLSCKTKLNNTKLMIEAIKQNNLQKTASLLNNDLEKAILPDYPLIEEIKQFLTEKGCINTLMSGSGSSVFGINDKTIDLSEIKKTYNESFIVTTLDRGISPE